MENHHQQQGTGGGTGGAGGGGALTGPGGGLDSAASFLQEEEDEFERLFTELLYASHSRAAAKMADLEERGEGSMREPPPPPPPSQWPSLKRSHRRSGGREGEAPGEEEGTRRAVGGGRSSSRVFVGPGEQLSDYERSLEEQGVILVRSGSASPDTGQEGDEEEDSVYYQTGGAGSGVICDSRDLDLDGLNGQTIINYSEGSSDDEEEQLANCSDGSDESYSDRLDKLLPDSEDLPVLHVEESGDEQEGEKKHPEGEQLAGPEQLAASMESFLAKSRQKRPSLQQQAAFKKSRSFQCGDSGEGANPLQQAAFRKSHSFQSGDSEAGVGRAAATRDRHSDGSFGSGGVLTRSGGPLKKGDTGDKLFFDLLDDLDDLTGNTQSMRRRQRARDIFSDWIFSEQLASEGEQKKKNRQSFHEFMTYREEDEFAEDDTAKPEQQPERQSRAGSEPSEGKHGNNNRNSYGNTDFVPLQKTTAKPLSMSDKDAVLERQMREEYLMSQEGGTGNRSPPTMRRALASRSDSSGSAVIPSPPTSTTVSSPNSKSPATCSNNNNNNISPNISSQQSSPHPSGINSPKPKSNRGSGFSANVDTLEMLKHVKFRNQKSPKCQVYSEAEAKAEQLLSSRFNALEVGPRNIYQRWKLKGRPISFEYLDEVGVVH